MGRRSDTPKAVVVCLRSPVGHRSTHAACMAMAGPMCRRFGIKCVIASLRSTSRRSHLDQRPSDFEAQPTPKCRNHGAGECRFLAETGSSSPASARSPGLSYQRSWSTQFSRSDFYKPAIGSSWHATRLPSQRERTEAANGAWQMATPTPIADPTTHRVRVAWNARRAPRDVRCRADATTPGAVDA